MSEAAFSNEKACFGRNGVDVLFELMRVVYFYMSSQLGTRTDSQRPSALETFNDALTTASNLSFGMRGINFVNPNDL